MPIRAVIFDLGGVLLRTEDRSPREQLARSLGMTYDELSQLIFNSESAQSATLGKISKQAHWAKVREMLKLSRDEFTRVSPAFWGGDKMDESLIAYLRSLRSNCRTALLSNAWDDLRENIESRWKIADAFDEIIISSEVGIAKPDPRIYRIALERLEVDPEEAVFVDDFIENVEAARLVGMFGIHFTGSKQACTELNNFLDGK